MKVPLLPLLLVLCSAMRAQTTGASLQGSVLDPGGAAIANASVEIRNTETNVSRTLTTDSEGRYREPQLLPGSYEIRASAQGFQTTIRKGVTLAVGQDGLIDFRLEIGRTDSSITVTENVSQINLVTGSLTGLVNQSQMRDLPLNGRSFQQLAVLQPGVIGLTSAGNDVVGGRTPKISINGARPEGSSFLLDGTDINNVYNKTPGSVAGVLLGVEAVREFVVMTNAYSAEFGRSSGGVLNAVTRSGTNEFHGSLFHFHRNSAMDAKNFFDPAARKIPAFKRNQFGGVLGGPIRREKTFFFGAFESLIERLGVAGLTNVPDADARRGILPGRPQFQVHPLIPQYLSTFFPMPNGRNLGGGLAEYQFNNSQPTNEYFAQGRVDHRISDKDSLFGRFTFSNGNVIRQMTAKPPVNTTQERSRNQYLTLEEQHIFTPTLLNTLRLSYARSASEADNVRSVTIPKELNWIPQEPFGYFTITGVVTEAAGDFRLPRNDYLNNYQWHNTMFWTKGAHGIRFGGEGQRMQFNQNTTSQRGGIVTFNGLENFLRGIPLSADFAVPGKIDPIRGYRQSLFGFFLQDDYRAKSNLTINLGVRYEFITVPTEVNGKISNLRQVTDSALTIGAPWHTNPSLKNFSPRVGMAWDPFKSGKTSVRAGFGIFYDQILPRYYFFSGSLNPPFTTRTTIANPTFPNIIQNFDINAPIRAQLQTVNFDLQPAYALQFNASIQRSITKDLDITIGYAGSRGVHLFRIADANLAPETIVGGIKTYQPTLGRRNPNFTTITQRISDAQSFYNSLQVTAAKRMAAGLRAQVSYTFSRAVDDSSGINSQDFDSSATYSMDFYDRKADRGLSSFWAKHVMVANWSYELPFFRNGNGLKKALLGGWQLNSITTAQTGHPFEVRLGFNRSGNLNTTAFSFRERPDAVAGCDQVNGGPDRYWNINCFTLPAINTRGNLGRNTLIGPSLVMVDASLFKEFKFNESRNLQFRAEIFNLPNRPNFQIPPSANRTAFTAVTRDAQGREVPTIPGSWGRITSTVTTSRQIQLGMKLTF